MKTMNTKKALIASLLSLVLCVSMLVGSTFAWFTDTASTGVNSITSGNLRVEIQDESGNKLTKLEWKASDGRAQDQILWEPGCTYTLTPFKIVNTGNLALKYKLVVTGLDGDSELLKVIQFTYKIGTDDFALNKEGHLAANGGKTGLITVSATMASDAGNEYMGKTLDNVKFTVYATQDTVENDSFGNRYDQFATYAPSGEMYTVTNYEEAKRAFAAGGIITVKYFEVAGTKTEVADRLVIKNPSVLNLDGSAHFIGTLGTSDNWAALFINADTTINASSHSGIVCTTTEDKPYVAHVEGDGIVVTVNGGTYHGGSSLFNVEKGTLIVNGGFFQSYAGDCRYILNCNDANHQNGTAKIIVKGGTFVNFDPSNNAAEGAGTNFVADGYKAIPEPQANGDVWYTVVPK